MKTFKEEGDISIHRFNGKVVETLTETSTMRYLLKESENDNYVGFIYPDITLAPFKGEEISMLVVIRRKSASNTIIKKIADKLSIKPKI